MFGIVPVMLALILGAVTPTVTVAQEEVFGLLEPTGSYQIGTTTYHWVDEARDETFTDDPNDHRELLVRIWYPADVEAQATEMLYFEGFSEDMGAEVLPAHGSVWQEISQWKTHACPDAPVSSALPSYPVLIFSPRSNWIPEEYTIQIEELASHGYVVVGINHPYFSGATLFPDGRIVTGTGLDFTNANELAAAQILLTQDVIFVLD